MSAKVSEPKKKTVKKPKAVSPEVIVDGTALKKAIAVREPVKTYNYGEVWGSRFVADEETHTVKRQFIAIPVDSTEDLANEPEKQKQLRNLIKNKLVGLDYWPKDDKLIANTLQVIEAQMDSLRHDVQYGNIEKMDEEALSSKTITNAIAILVRIMHEVNNLITIRRNILQHVRDGKLKAAPLVAPPPNEYRIVDGHFVRNETDEERMAKIDKEFGFEEVDLNDESVPEPVRELAKKLGKTKTVHVATMPVKK